MRTEATLNRTERIKAKAKKSAAALSLLAVAACGQESSGADKENSNVPNTVSAGEVNDLPVVGIKLNQEQLTAIETGSTNDRDKALDEVLVPVLQKSLTTYIQGRTSEVDITSLSLDQDVSTLLTDMADYAVERAGEHIGDPNVGMWICPADNEDMETGACTVNETEYTEDADLVVRYQVVSFNSSIDFPDETSYGAYELPLQLAVADGTLTAFSTETSN